MNPVSRLFEHRVRGFRSVELIALACLGVMVFWVYMAKAGAGRERTQIAQVEQQIGLEQRKVKLLRAEAAKLERPARIEALSENYLGLKPVDAKREAAPDGLSRIAQGPAAGAKPAEPAPPPEAAPEPDQPQATVQTEAEQ